MHLYTHVRTCMHVLVLSRLLDGFTCNDNYICMYMCYYSDVIAFATEPVFVSLANVLGYYDNLPSPLPLPIKVNNVY